VGSDAALTFVAFPLPQKRHCTTRREWRDTGLTDSGGRGIAVHDVHIDLSRRGVHARQLILMEVALVDRAVRRGDFTEQRPPPS
jgi:hypothetical protein